MKKFIDSIIATIKKAFSKPTNQVEEVQDPIIVPEELVTIAPLETPIVKELTLVEKLIILAKKKDYAVFEDNSKDFNLNIWFIRSEDPTPDTFNDKCVVFWKNLKGSWEQKQFTVTTDPGLYWMTKRDYHSVAILAEGQYRGTHKIDIHRAGTKSAHKALCQRLGVVKVYRDGNKDKIHDFDVPTQTGTFGINCHQPSIYSEQNGIVHSSSAGCLVFSKRKDFDNPTNSFDKNTFMGLMELSAKEWVNRFSITLCTELELNQIN